ncbi:ATP-binding protein [Streptomyces ziwulingensis]
MRRTGVLLVRRRARYCSWVGIRAETRSAFVRQVLTEWGHTDRPDDVTLCVSELATNALLHGAPPGREYRVSLALDGSVIRLAVRDSGDRHLSIDAPQADVEACSGRGLRLAREVGDDMGVTQDVVGKSVRVVFTTVSPSECAGDAACRRADRPTCTSAVIVPSARQGLVQHLGAPPRHSLQRLLAGVGGQRPAEQ